MAKKKTRKASKAKNFLRFIGCIVMIAAIVYFVSGIKKEVSTTFSLIADLNESKLQLQQLENEKESLLEQKEKLNDDNYVSGVARAKYLITKENEQIFTFPPLED